MNIELCRLAAADGGDGVKLYITCDGESESIVISNDDYIELAPEKGKLEEGTLDEIRVRAVSYAAKRAALRILAAGQCSEKKLAEKLRLRRFSARDAAAAAAFAAAAGYIDECAQVENLVDSLFFRKGYGPRKIRPMLLAKGYAKADIDRAIADRITKEDVAKAKAALLVKKFGKTKPESYEEAAAFRAALYRGGF